MASTLRPIKVTAVGDGNIGKTCLLITYTTSVFPPEYVPTVFDNYAGNIKVDGQEFNMTLWDTAGQEDYERLRPLSYPNTDCFLLCYAIDSRASYENIITKWCPEIRHFSPSVPIVLVATKGDLRKAPTQNVDDLITPSEGKKMKNRIRAWKHIECSALANNNLEEVFVEAIRAAVHKPHVKQRVCVLV